MTEYCFVFGSWAPCGAEVPVRVATARRARDAVRADARVAGLDADGEAADARGTRGVERVRSDREAELRDHVPERRVVRPARKVLRTQAGGDESAGIRGDRLAGLARRQVRGLRDEALRGRIHLAGACLARRHRDDADERERRGKRSAAVTHGFLEATCPGEGASRTHPGRTQRQGALRDTARPNRRGSRRGSPCRR